MRIPLDENMQRLASRVEVSMRDLVGYVFTLTATPTMSAIGRDGHSVYRPGWAFRFLSE